MNQYPNSDLSFELDQAVDAVARSLLEQLQWSLSNREVSTIEGCRERLADALRADGTESLDMSLDDKVDAIEEHAADTDISAPFEPETIRQRIEEAANHIVVRLGGQRAMDLLDELEKHMSCNDLELSDMVSANYLAHLPHRAERSEGDGFTVYEYRNIDGFDVDLFEVRVGSMAFFFAKPQRRCRPPSH